jgi:multidrug resistance efflux pump
LESRLKANKEHYDNILAIINSRNGLLSEYSGKSSQQTKLRIKYEKDKSNELKNDLVESKKALELSEKQYERVTVLIKDGFVSQADLDKAKATYEQDQAAYLAKKAKVDQSQSQIKAAEKGLQVDGSQAVSFQEARRKDLEIELLNLSQQAAEAKLQVDLTQSELEQTNEHLKKEREAKIFMPIDGVIWSIPAKSGENIIAGQPVIKVINCNDRWIEAFVPESDIGKVHIGSPVKVGSLSADKKVWNGYIQSIRGGTNRVKVGEDVDILPPELVRRQMTLRIAVDWEREGNEFIEKGDRASKFSEFCQVGNSVEVTFIKQRN